MRSKETVYGILTVCNTNLNVRTYMQNAAVHLETPFTASSYSHNVSVSQDKIR